MPQFNPFPVGYQPYNGYQQYQYTPQQMPANSWGMPSGQMPQQNSPVQQDMTPTIRMDIKQIESIDAISRTPPAPGTTGAYMTKDENTIIFRSVYANGEYTDKIYDKRPPEPQKPEFDPSAYVRKDEINDLISRALSQRKPLPKKDKEDESK